MPITPILLAACLAPLQQGAEIPLARLAPAETTAFVSWRTPRRHLDRLQTWSPLDGLEPEGGWLEAIEDPGLRDWLRNLDSAPLDLLQDLAGRGIEFALVPTGEAGDPSMLLVLEQPDAARGRRALDDVLDAIGEQLGFPRLFRKPNGSVAGRDAYFIGDELTLVVEERRVILSNDRELLESAFEAARRPGHLGLLGSRAFQSCRAMATSGPDIWAFVDVEGGRDAQPQLDRWAGNFSNSIQRPQPLAILGPAFATWADSGAWSAWLEPGPSGFEFGLAAGSHSGYGSALRPDAPDAGSSASSRNARPAPVERPGDLLNGLLYRDFSAWLGARVDLFDEGAQARLVAQLAELENLFGGVAFDRDLTPQLSPWWRVVGRRLDFGSWPQPSMELPGVALVGRLSEPMRWGPYLEAGFQSLAVLSNVDRAQNGQVPLLLRPGQVEQLPYTAAHFPPPLDPSEVDAVFNAAPAFAVAGEHVVLASHEALLREVISDLREATPSESAASNIESLHIHGAALHELFAPQLDTFAVLHALEEGLEIDAAHHQLSYILEAVRGFDVRATIQYPSDAVIVRSTWDWQRPVR